MGKNYGIIYEIFVDKRTLSNLNNKYSNSLCLFNYFYRFDDILQTATEQFCCMYPAKNLGSNTDGHASGRQLASHMPSIICTWVYIAHKTLQWSSYLGRFKCGK